MKTIITVQFECETKQQVDTVKTLLGTPSSERLHYDDHTLDIVFASITNSSQLGPHQVQAIINQLQNDGILFRERAKD